VSSSACNGLLSAVVHACAQNEDDMMACKGVGWWEPGVQIQRGFNDRELKSNYRMGRSGETASGEGPGAALIFLHALQWGYWLRGPTAAAAAALVSSGGPAAIVAVSTYLVTPSDRHRRSEGCVPAQQRSPRLLRFRDSELCRHISSNGFYDRCGPCGPQTSITHLGTKCVTIYRSST